MIGPAEVDRFVPRLRAIEEVIYAVAEVYGVAPTELIGRARTKTITEARICVYAVARRCTRMSYPEIGSALNRDHTTVINGCASAKQKSARDPYFAGVVEELCERFGEPVEVTRQ